MYWCCDLRSCWRWNCISLDNRGWYGFLDRSWLASRAVEEGCYLAKIFPVPLCYGSGSVNTDGVTVIGSYLNNNPSLGPLARIVTSLVLYCHTITWLQCGRLLVPLESCSAFWHRQLPCPGLLVSTLLWAGIFQAEGAGSLAILCQR